MITYELANRLKDAGFPQKANYEHINVGICRHGVVYSNEMYRHRENCRCNEFVYIPTLAELIEACGDRFTVLERQTNIEGKDQKGNNVIIPVIFKAHGFIQNNEITETFRQGVGISAEEAVATLWLTLNEKKI